MSAANAYLPLRSFNQRTRPLDLRVVAILSFIVAICCAAIVFGFLYNFDQPYPANAVSIQTAPSPFPAMPAGVQSDPSRGAPVDVSETNTVEAHTEPSAPVARTHDELLAIERAGDRHFVEFSVSKSNTFQPVGPVEIGLWRTDARRGTVQISVLAGHRRTDYKHVNAYERLWIPTRSRPIELVIIRISKNQITGYVSERKHA